MFLYFQQRKVFIKLKYYTLLTLAIVIGWSGIACKPLLSPTSIPRTEKLAPTAVWASTTPASSWRLGDLVAQLSLNKLSYQIGEPITATLTLTNVSDTDLVVKDRMIFNSEFSIVPLRDVTFKILDSAGNSLPFTSRVNASVPERDQDFVVLSSGEHIERAYNVANDFPIMESGTYSIQGRYENYYDPDNKVLAWKGIVLTNVIQFSIEK